MAQASGRTGDAARHLSPRCLTSDDGSGPHPAAMVFAVIPAIEQITRIGRNV